MEQISGLIYEDDVISEDMETQLIEFLQNIEYDSILHRKTKSYGYRYKYAHVNNSSSEEVEPIPDILDTLNVDNFNTDSLIMNNLNDKVNAEVDANVDVNSKFNQCIINVYEPGEGIAAHIDDTRLFGDKIVIYSLGSDIEMEFSPKFHKDTVIKLILKRRSKITLENEARYDWTHCIKKRKSDNKIKRDTRYSITFRDYTPKH